VATSEAYADFAFVTLTRDELASGLEDRRCHMGLPKPSLIILPYGKISGITKSFTCTAGAPALVLTFRVTGIPREEHIREKNGLSALGKFKL